MIPKSPHFESGPEVCRIPLRIFGANFWCRDNPRELILDGSSEVDRLECFHEFCRSKNEVEVVRILTFNWALHKRRIPELAAALGSLQCLREIYFDNFSHYNAEYDVLRYVLEATKDMVEEVHISCDGEAFDSGNEAWCHALRQCERLRVFHMKCRAGILLNSLCKVPLYNPRLEEVYLRSAQIPQTLQGWHVKHLTELPGLRRLKLEKFSWTDDACQVMAEFCQGCRLTNLELPFCQWETTSSATRFLAVLPTTLECLNLQECQLDVTGVDAVARILPQSRLAHVNLSGNRSLSDACVRNLWRVLPEAEYLRHLDLQQTNLSPSLLTDFIEEKEAVVPHLETMHLDRQQTSRPWTREECNRVAQTLLWHPHWVELGKQWENADPAPEWNVVDRLLWLNRLGRARVLAGHLDPADFMARFSFDTLATFLYIQHDAVAMGLFPSPVC